MHESVFAWVAERVAALGLGAATPVLEVGSCDVNGSIRCHFDQKDYTGVDIAEGPGVDVVVRPTELPFVADRFAVVVSTEMLEHAEFPERVVGEMIRVLHPSGTLLLTTRSEGFPYHNPPDYHRFSAEQLGSLLRGAGFVRCIVTMDPQVPGVFAVAYKA